MFTLKKIMLAGKGQHLHPLLLLFYFISKVLEYVYQLKGPLLNYVRK